jgi:diadenosine tetraphosphatase ApaH/serine/threonine PP2A family protein phosphatase
MRIAVIADVHANVSALEAVLGAIEARSVDQIVCLGDLVGYNAEPARAVAMVDEACDVIVAGNHDRDCLHTAQEGTHKTARVALDWTRQQLGPREREILAALPPLAVTEHYVAAHGSYLSEIYVSGYVTSTMLEKNLIAIDARSGWPTVALCGHTHVPMLGWWDGQTVHESRISSPEEWPARARSVLVNPGSVGQPRDGDPRAAFAVIDFDARRVESVRVPYDIDRACTEIERAGLPTSLAERLREGR